MDSNVAFNVLRADNFCDEITDEKKLVLLACVRPGEEFKRQSDMLKAMALHYTRGLKVCLLTNDDAKAIMNRFGVDGTPTYLILKKGREKERVLGEVDFETLSASVAPFIR